MQEWGIVIAPYHWVFRSKNLERACQPQGAKDAEESLAMLAEKQSFLLVS